MSFMLAMSMDDFKSMLVMQGFAGFSLFAVFLLMALGLAIIFGQMKVINMAHGEFLTAGAYVTVFMSHMVNDHFPKMQPYYYPVAMVAAFLVAAIIGYFVEILLIRYLYKRPLDTLLATFGLSLIMQQLFRSIFGAREDTATLPEWLMGSWSVTDTIDIPLNGLFLLGLAILVVLLVYFLMFRTRWGLYSRSTMQNRAMAGAVGINTKKIDRFTFAFGCGLAGLAGAAFTTIGSVSPSAGGLYIVDTFVVVVFGGAGSILGTVLSAFSIAQSQSILEFFLQGVMAKVLVLLGVVVLLMIRPQGIIADKVRKV